MPGGIANPIVSYGAFCAVKLLGYSLYGVALRSAYEQPEPEPFKLGAVRTALGMAAGAIYYMLYAGVFGIEGDPVLSYYLLGLIPMRILEWWIIVWVYYDREFTRKRLGWRVVLVGTLWSYVLDLPAVAGFVATAGLWVC